MVVPVLSEGMLLSWFSVLPVPLGWPVSVWFSEAPVLSVGLCGPVDSLPVCRLSPVASLIVGG